MMRVSDQGLRVLVWTQPVDFRKGMASLAVLVETQLSANPFANTLYVFRNRSATAIKLLYWERNGFCLWQKRLEQERFCWPKGGGLGCKTACKTFQGPFEPLSARDDLVVMHAKRGRGGLIQTNYPVPSSQNI